MSKKTDEQIILQALQEKALPISESLQSFKIKTAADYKRKAEQVKALKMLGKEAETKLKAIVDPINDSVKRIKELFKPFITSVALLEQQAKLEMIDFDAKQQAKQLSLDQKFEETGMSISKHTKESSKLTEHQTGVASTRRRYEVTVKDESKLPRKYLMPNMALIKADYKAGVKIPGVALEEIKSIAI